MPQISVVLPVFNGEKYLRKSIDSILLQTFTDWELIIVDDCSTDSTPIIIDEYVQKESRIRNVTNRANQKLPKSLNIGFSYAKGEFLTWTSDDNLYLSNAFQVMAETLQKNTDVPMVVADMEIVNEIGESISNEPISYHPDQMYWRNCVGACFLYRRAVKEKIGDYDEAKVLVEDYDYWLRILKSCGAILRIPRVLYHYRRHNLSLTSQKRHDVGLQNLKLVMGYFPDIMEKFSDGKEKITKLYYDTGAMGVHMESFRKDFLRFVPELAYDISFYNMKFNERGTKVVVFGAGMLGDEIIEGMRDRVLAFVDNDVHKIGTYRNGILVHSLLEARVLYPSACIMIAVKTDYIYTIIRQLLENGVREFFVSQIVLQQFRGEVGE